MTCHPVPSSVKAAVAALPSARGQARGSALEAVAVEFFGTAPGMSVAHRDVYSHRHSQELDVVLTNDPGASLLNSAGEVVLVECKYWNRPVGCAEVAWFDYKLRLSGHAFGFLLVVNGLTGEARDRSNAWDIMFRANQDKRRLILCRPSELAAMADYCELKELVQTRLAALAAQAPPF